MQLRRYEDAAEFYNHVQPFLLAHEAENNVLLGVLTTLIKTDTYQHPPYLACVEDTGEVVAVVLRTPPHNVSLSLMDTFEPLQLFADDLHRVYPELVGVNGAKEVVGAFAPIWQAVSGQNYRVGRQLRIYRLECVRPIRSVQGEYRKASEEYRERLIDWFMAFFAEAVEAVPREEAERGVEIRLNADPSIRGLRLWYDNGKPVSIAGYSGPTPNGIRVGPVYTPPEYRGQGYASGCVAALSQELLEQGRKFCFLFTDLSNPTSNHIYQNIGYEPIGDVDEYRFEEKSEIGV
jgi:predicted GNAT family acetyltransferase